ncbi:hypothetical protein K2O51_33500 (plasmid) [Cupriavidus pinatubonensis]|nr:hypothetical protein [Cupriavidus pinatubonensis]QYY33767.1 hypothetical protein K2O51_33500 [Cupriavidus pinatubonensis]
MDQDVIFITRRTYWFDDADGIPLAEWIAVVDNAPGFRAFGQADGS